MTAELFVKLASKLYADRLRLGDSPPSLSEDEPGGGDGGVKLDSQPFTESDPLDLSVQTSNAVHSMGGLSDNLPSAWHAAEMQKLNSQMQKSNVRDCNPYAVLENSAEETDSGVEDSGMEEDPTPAQWIPPMTSIFWGRYANKLRVNASQDGVCDLNEEY
jgi:hypothetical protein